jgi:F-type H+-transporting ATPase subunit b
MPQFDVTTFSSQIFWLLVCFAILCAFMVMHLAPRLAATLEGRERRLQEDWERAKSLSLEVELMKTESRAQLRASQEKAHHLIRQVSDQSHANKLAHLKVLDGELTVKMHKIRASLEQDKQMVRENMAMIVSQIVTTAAPRILGQSVTQSQVTPIVEAMLKKRSQV